MPGGSHSIRFALRHQSGADRDGRIFLCPDCRRGRIGHFNNSFCMNQFQTVRRDKVHFFHVVREFFLVSDQKNLHIRDLFEDTLDCLHDYCGSVISSHCINCDLHPGEAPLILPF